MTEHNDTDEAKRGKTRQRNQMIKFFAFMIISAGAALYMMIKEIEPARAIMDLQADWFNGKYYPKATFAVLWIMILVAIAIVYSFFDWIIRLINDRN